MLYSDTLLKSFNDKYDELLIKEEKLRKEIATMIYCFYTNNKSGINYYVKKYMLDSGVHDLKIWNSATRSIETLPDGSNQVGMFTEKTVNIMPKIHIDIVRKVIDLVCTILNAGADRYLLDGVNINQTETDNLMELYEEMNYSQSIIEQYKQGWLFNTILAQPVYRNGTIEIDIITPNFCSVETYENDYSRMKAVMISKSINNEDMIVYWSDTEHYYINSKGVKLNVTDEEGNSNGMRNPFGTLPFAKLSFNQSSDFWGEPQQDLVENNIWYDVKESNQIFVEMFQGLGVGLGVNLGKTEVVSISPNTIIQVDNVRADDQPPSLTFASTSAPLAELRESTDYMYRRIGNSKGLSSASMTNEVTEQSGVSKAYDSLELQIKKDSHKIVMKNYERELFEKIRLVNNYYAKKN